jgi:hypothetical protein
MSAHPPRAGRLSVTSYMPPAVALLAAAFLLAPARVHAQYTPAERAMRNVFTFGSSRPAAVTTAPDRLVDGASALLGLSPASVPGARQPNPPAEAVRPVGGARALLGREPF